MENFHLLVVLQPPQLKNSASHGAHKKRVVNTLRVRLFIFVNYN
ncbi:hypothetical protein HMPREF1611_01263 [Escherichia coli 908573]|nr:hypothetical protein HMPREF1611_01263 [Escherichia coli 908573]